MAGGALFNHLDYSFATGRESGDLRYDTSTPGGGSVALRKQLSNLKKFIEQFDYINMKPDSNFFSDKMIRGNALSEKGKQYAAYFINDKNINEVALNVPTGRYNITWFLPKSGRYERTYAVSARNNKLYLKVPQHNEDLALKIIAR